MRPSGAHSAAHSGVERSRSERISATYACPAFSSTPSPAIRAAGSARLSSGSVPQRLIASQTPAGVPYTPHEEGPTWNTCAASPNDTLIATSSAAELSSRSVERGSVGASTKKSRSVASRPPPATRDRKSTRLNSSHSQISYAVFCLKKKNKKDNTYTNVH